MKEETHFKNGGQGVFIHTQLTRDEMGDKVREITSSFACWEFESPDLHMGSEPRARRN